MSYTRSLSELTHTFPRRPNKFIDIAQRTGILELVLNAQISAAGFYTRYGFSAEGDEFMDAGIPHLRMTLDITKLRNNTC